MIKQEKLSYVKKLLELLVKHPNFILVKIDRTTHQTLETLRKELKTTHSLFKVIKNTLLGKAINKLAQKEKKYLELKKSFFPLKETSALLLFDEDWTKGLNAFYSFSKKEPTLSFKFGLLDWESHPPSDLIKIAQLPSKNQLVANIIGSINSPTSRFVSLTKSNIYKLVYLLRQKPKQ